MKNLELFYEAVEKLMTEYKMIILSMRNGIYHEYILMNIKVKLL